MLKILLLIYFIFVHDLILLRAKRNRKTLLNHTATKKNGSFFFVCYALGLYLKKNVKNANISANNMLCIQGVYLYK